MRTCVIVLGMHRSGTSALTGLLSLLGAHPGIDLMPDNEFNPKGYWELQPVVRLNEELLTRLGRLWDDVMPLPPNWVSLPAITELMPRAEEILARELSQSTLSLLKDPRLCLLLPFWAECLAAQKFESKYIVIARSPGETAASLEWRYQFSPDKCAWLWLRHMLDAERSTRGKIRFFLSFDDLLADWRAAASNASKGLDLQLSITPDAAAAADAFLDPHLRHFDGARSVASKPSADSDELQGFCGAVYALLRKSPGGDLSKKEMLALDQVRERFEAWSAEHVAAEIPREQAWIRSVVLALNDRVAGMQSAAVAAEAQIANQRSQLADMERAHAHDAASLLDMQRRNDGLAADVSALSRRNASLEENLELANKRNEALSKDVSLLSQKTSSLEAELKDAKERSEALVADASALTRQTTDLAAEVRRAGVRCTALETELSKAAEHRATLDAELSAAGERESAIAGQLAVSSEQRAELESRLYAASDQSERLENCLRASLAFHVRGVAVAEPQAGTPAVARRDEAAEEGLRFACERPESRNLITGLVDIEGWCFGTASQVIGVEVLWNAARLIAQYGGLRDDVAQAHPECPGAARSGFRCAVDARPGDYFLSIVALCDNGKRVRLGEGIVSVRPHPLLGNLDIPALVGLREETTRFAGWCLSRDNPISSLALRVGNSRFPCVYGLHREDVAAAFPDVAYSGRSGFECDVGLVPGSFDIRIEATLTSGEILIETAASQVRVGGVFDLERALRTQGARIGGAMRVGRLAVMWMRRQHRIPRWHELPSLLRKVRTQLRMQRR